MDFQTNIDNNQPVFIVGMPNSGKTQLAFFLAKQTRREKKYILGYPKPVDGFITLHDIDSFSQLQDCVLVIDELARYFPPWVRKTNSKLLEFLQFAQHNNVKLITDTQMTHTITKQVESFVTCYAVKQIRMRTLKNGSTVKDVLKNIIKHPNITSDYVKIGVDEFVWYNELGHLGENGIYTFPEQGIGKDWKSNPQKNLIAQPFNDSVSEQE